MGSLRDFGKLAPGPKEDVCTVCEGYILSKGGSARGQCHVAAYEWARSRVDILDRAQVTFPATSTGSVGNERVQAEIKGTSERCHPDRLEPHFSQLK